jgi:Domain of unknown function (DUF1835)
MGAQLFIVNGDSAAGSLGQAIGSDQGILVQQDVLSCGPLPPLETVEQWREVREQFWQNIWGDLPSPSPISHHSRDLLWNTDALRRAEAVCLWMGSGLSDQLLLPSTAHLLELVGAEPAEFSTVQFSRYPGRPLEIVGLGMLAPDELKNHPAPEPTSTAGIAELKGVWTAVTAPEPRRLLALLREEAVVFPLLRRALKTMIARYPDERTGLNYIDWDLLTFSKARGPKVASVIAHAMRSNAEHLDPVGDLYLLARLRGLADPHLPHAALDLKGDSSSIHSCEVRITSTGEKVLAGHKNFVELNGVDDWVGGVHLDSRTGAVWFRCGEELVGPATA